MRKRNRTITIRCTDDEYERIHNKAQRHKLSLSDFVIKSALDKKAVWLEAERARRVQAQTQIENSQVDSDLAVGLDSIVSGVTAVASIIEDEPADDTEYAREHVDSKALAEERERKEALGIHMG